MTYLPPHFAETETAKLHALVRAHPLATWVVQHQGELLVNHIPMLLDADRGEHGTLVGHVARANPVWQALTEGAASVAVFTGPQAYVSPNWYPSKHAAHRQVPTWNYRVVHVHGRATLRDDEKFVRGVVGRLTRAHEQQAQGTAPHPAGAWKMSDADPHYLQQMLSAIVGLEIQITRLEGKFKLGQNRSEEDRAGAVEWLEKGQQTQLAAQMRMANPSTQ